MALYAVSNYIGGGTQQNIPTTFTTNATQLSIVGGASAGARRGWVYEMEIGPSGPPNTTDCSIIWDVSLVTAAGTNTATTPVLLDVQGADYAAQLTYGSCHTAEPTYTANSSIFAIGLNQRASQRWIARDEKSSIIIPGGTSAKGYGFRARSSNYGSTVGWQAYIAE